MKLTIGMASFKNYAEVMATIQALRLYHDLSDTELLVVDNFGDDRLEKVASTWGAFRYVRYTERQGTAAPRSRVFEEATGKWVMCIDSHVFLSAGAVARFKAWAEAHPGCMDLLHGPMLYDDLRITADAMTPSWAGTMWGEWRAANVSDEQDAYEIPMHGLGLFACRKDAWLGFNPAFRGFGGEEGYIHEKYRRAGRKVMLLPWLKWWHLFHTQFGECSAPYTPQVADVIHNYEAGFAELGLDPTPMRRHFGLESGAVAPLRETVPPPTIKQVQIDPNGACGSKCWFCPVRYIPRPPSQVMPLDLFERILDSVLEGVRFGSVAPGWGLWLSSYNDILIDPLLEGRLDSLRRRGLRFPVLTNAVGLLKNVDLIHDYRDVAVGWAVDLPAGDPESYARHTGNSPEFFGRIIEGLRALHTKDPVYYGAVLNVNVNGAFERPIDRAQLLYDLPAGDTDRQVAELRALLPMLRVEAARPLCDRAGHLAPYAIDNGRNREQWKRPSLLPATGCNNGGDRLTEWLHVNSLGKAYSCCQDYEEKYAFGDLTVESVHTITTRPRPEVLEAVRRDLCDRCILSE